MTLLRIILLLLPATLFAVANPAVCRGEESDFTPEQLEFFENRVRPLLAEHCARCHNAEEHKGNLVLDSRENLLKGGDTGPSVSPGNIDASELIKAVRYGADGYQMPPDGKLDDAAIATLEEWVGMGAPWPATAAAARTGEAFNLAERARLWSFQPLQRAQPPKVTDTAWPQSPIDRFLLARLEDAGLHPAPTADRATWLRRAYLDTLGLPPAPSEVASFVTDSAPDACERAIEVLLASPRFGERWGRHWLDLVRYAESRGHEFDYDVANPWHYRDYVIRAINEDVPYDRFVIEHVAGDLLNNPAETAAATRPARFDPATGANESVVATGFWFLGEWVHSPVDIRQEEAERFANMLDVYSKAFLGLTVACARCHDHKFDPITQQDYYALQGYLQSSVYRQALYESMDHNRRIARELESLRDEASAALRPLLAQLSKSHTRPTNDPTTTEVALPEGAQIVVDYSQPDVVPLTEGSSLGTRPVRPGEVLLSNDPQRPVRAIAAFAAVERNPLWRSGQAADELDDPGRLAGWNRAGQTLRTPTFDVSRNKLFILMRGGCNTYVAVDSHVTINGPLHGALTKGHGNQPVWRWIEHDVSRYLGHRAHLELVPRGDEPFEVRQVIQSDQSPRLVAGPPSPWDDLLNEPTDPCTDWLRSESVRQQLAVAAAPFIARQRELLSQLIPQSAATPAMAEGTPEDEFVFIRGNWKKPGRTVPRRFLEVFSVPRPSTLVPGPSSSGRIDLASQMIDPQQTPILPRVIVNRIWQHYFGRGLVPSSDDFGHMGQPPSHPELLDWLATELVANDWSLKHIHRLILQSSAYRMDSSLSTGAVAAVDEVDPLNTLLHHMPVKRLEGEIVRDQLLALSGRLDDRLYGRSVPIHLTAFLEGRGRPGESGPLDGRGRRSIYLAVRRNFPEPFLQAFDFPNPHTSIGRRSVSNVPAQALALMNNPFVIQQAKLWSARMLQETPQGGVRERIAHLYESAVSRPPTADEVAQGEAFLARQAPEYNVDVNHPLVWADYCHVLINVKEFVFVR